MAVIRSRKEAVKNFTGMKIKCTYTQRRDYGNTFKEARHIFQMKLCTPSNSNTMATKRELFNLAHGQHAH